MKKFSELQVNDYIFECCDDFPKKIGRAHV